MAVNDSIWIETTADQYANIERAYVLPRGRRTAETKDFKLVCSVWQALRVSRIEQPVVLVRVERVA